MHLKGEPEPLGLEPVLSNLLDDEFVLGGAELMLLVDEKPSDLTCSAMTSSALNCYPNYKVLKPKYIESFSRNKQIMVSLFSLKVLLYDKPFACTHKLVLLHADLAQRYESCICLSVLKKLILRKIIKLRCCIHFMKHDGLQLNSCEYK